MQKINTIESLIFSKGGYGTMSFSLRALYNIVNFDATTNSFHPEITKNITYSNEKMQELIDKLNELQVLKWKDLYDSHELDGTQWELKLNYNHIEVKKIFGSNAYPNDKFEIDLKKTPQFENLLKALSEFIDEESFFEQEYFEKHKEK